MNKLPSSFYNFLLKLYAKNYNFRSELYNSGVNISFSDTYLTK